MISLSKQSDENSSLVCRADINVNRYFSCSEVPRKYNILLHGPTRLAILEEQPNVSTQTLCKVFKQAEHYMLCDDLAK